MKVLIGMHIHAPLSETPRSHMNTSRLENLFSRIDVKSHGFDLV